MNISGVVFNRSHERLGKLQLSRRAYFRMTEYGLDVDALDDTFRYGQEVEPGKIVQNYVGYSVGLLYAIDETRMFRGDLTTVRFIIITCWKEVRRYV